MLSSIKQAVFSIYFLAGTIAICIVIFCSSVGKIVSAFRSVNLLVYGFHGEFMLNALESEAIIVFIPIICTLPYSAAFIDDIKTGFIKYYLHRTSRNAYITGRIVGCMISGGTVLVLGVLLAYVVSALLFSPLEAMPLSGGTYIYFLKIITKCCLIFLSGAFWALIGMTLSTETGSKYVAYASPFILYYVFIILHERYFNWLYVIYPKEWLSPSNKWAFGCLGVVILLVELIIITSLRFSVVARRRMLEL